MLSRSSVRGVIVPIVTPLRDGESIDTAGLVKLLKHIVGGGVHGIFCLGTTGEFARLDEGQTREVIGTTVQAVGGKVPVYCGVGDCGTSKVLRNMRAAEGLGADVMVVTLPYYFPVRDPREQMVFFEQVIGSTDHPVILYNMPATIGSVIDLGVVEKLARKPNVLGIKDSSGELPYLQRLLAIKAGGNLRVLVGDESIAVAGLRLGADGVVPSLANVFPRLFVNLYDACSGGSGKRADELQERINRINAGLNDTSPSWLSSLGWKKKALETMGICAARLTQPFLGPTSPIEPALATLIAEGDDRGTRES